MAHEDPRPLRGPPARPGPRERTAWRERCVSGARPPRVASVLRGGRVPAFRRPHGPAVSGGEAPCQCPRAASQRVLNARPHLCLMDAKTVAVPVEGDARRRRRRPGRAVPLCVGARAVCASVPRVPWRTAVQGDTWRGWGGETGPSGRGSGARSETREATPPGRGRCASPRGRLRSEPRGDAGRPRLLGEGRRPCFPEAAPRWPPRWLLLCLLSDREQAGAEDRRSECRVARVQCSNSQLVTAA